MTKVTFLWNITGFRGRNDDGSETSATWKAALNTNWTQDTGVNFRVRLLLAETNGGAVNNVGFTWQYLHVQGTNTWTNITTSSSVVRAFTSGDAGFVDDADTTQQIGSGTFISDNNGQCEDGVTTAAAADFAGNDQTEVELCCRILGADVDDNDTIQIRVLVAGLPPDGTPTLPSITVNDTSARSGAIAQVLEPLAQSATGTVQTPADVSGAIAQALAPGVSRSTYYFDASVSGPTDAQGVWTDDANAFDGSTATVASTATDWNPWTGQNELRAVGYSGPASGDPISRVRVRVHGSCNTAGFYWAHVEIRDGSTVLGTAYTQIRTTSNDWGDWVVLDEPAGGWTYAKLDALECVIGLWGNDVRVSRVEIEVETGRGVLSQTAVGTVYRPKRSGTVAQALAWGAFGIYFPIAREFITASGVRPFLPKYAFLNADDTYIEPLSSTSDVVIETRLAVPLRPYRADPAGVGFTIYADVTPTSDAPTGFPRGRFLIYNPDGSLAFTSAWNDVDSAAGTVKNQNFFVNISNFNVPLNALASVRVRYEGEHISDGGGDAAVRVTRIRAAIGTSSPSLSQLASGHVFTPTGAVTGIAAQTLASVAQAAAGDVTGIREGAIAQALAAIDQAATGVVYRKISGSIAQTLGAVSQAAAGAAYREISGAIAQSLPVIVQAAIGDVTGVREGDIVQTLSPVSQAATGKAYRPITGLAAQTLGSIAQAASGGVFDQSREGVAAQTLAGIVQTAAGTVYDPSRVGAAAQVLAALSQSAIGDVVGVREGAIVQGLSALAQAATGSVYRAIAGSAAQVLAPVQQNATGAIVDASREGSIAQTLAAVTQAATGEVVGHVSGSAAQILTGLQQAAAGSVYRAISGTAAQTLPGIFQSAAGSVSDNSRVATIAQTLPSLLQTAAGTVYDPSREGTIVQTLPSVVQLATGSAYREISGVLLQSIESVSQAATGIVTGVREGSALSVLRAPTQDAIGTVYRAIYGVGAQTLGTVAQAATGTVELIRPFFVDLAVSISPDTTKAGSISTGVVKSVSIGTDTSK